MGIVQPGMRQCFGMVLLASLALQTLHVAVAMAESRRTGWHQFLGCRSVRIFVLVSGMTRDSTTRTASSWLAAILAMLVVAGCDDSGITRRAVYGRIAGAEGQSGLVSFVPRENTHGPAARASLVNGEYHFSRTDGPVPGDYTVIIQLEVSPDMTSGVAVFKGIEIPENSGAKIPMEYKAVASLPVSVPDGADSTLEVDLKLPDT
jgi:hypothetical protein